MSEDLPAPSARITALCERVLVEKDNTISLIRVFNRFTLQIKGIGTPEAMPPGGLPVTIVSSWTGGLGSHQVKAVVTGPGDTHLELPSQSFHLGSLDAAHNVVAPVSIPIKAEGLYWVSFELDGKPAARIPLRVIYSRTEMPRA